MLQQLVLDPVPELKAFILSTPDWKVRFGLPIAAVLRSDFQVVRLQRAVLQRWLIPTPWVGPGDITLGNVREIFKASGLIPAEALAPEALPPEGVVPRPDLARRAAELINHYRHALGLRPLRWDERLAAAADCRPEGQSHSCPVSHVDPSGRLPWERARAFGYPSGHVGENLAAVYKPPGRILQPDEAFAGWKDSPGHEANQTHPAWEEVGVGTARRELGGRFTICYYYVQFGRC